MTLTSQLNTLEFSGLIQLAQAQPELEYLFRHVLVQEAAYGSLVKQDRRHLHLAAGDALERLYAGRLEEFAPMLGRHFSEAGEDERALKYFTLAGDAAARVYANAEAVMHYDRALEIATVPIADRWPSGSTVKSGRDFAVAVPLVAGGTEQLSHLFTNRGRALELSGLYEEALANYSEMEALGHERGDRRLEMTALILRATIHATPTPRFDPQQGRLLLDRALAIAHELNDREAEVRILRNLMLLGKFSGTISEPLAYGERALALARELDLREDLAFTLNDINAVYQATGDLARAQTALQEASELWRELGNLPMLADSLASSANLNIYRGEYERALHLAAEARRISETIGNLWGQSYSRFMLDFIYFEHGELAQAIAVASECIFLAEQAGFMVPPVLIRAQLGMVYGFLGDTERGFENVRQALATVEQWVTDWRPLLLAMLAQLHLWKGDFAEAESAIREAERELESSAYSSVGALYLGLVGGQLALAQGDYTQVIALADGALATMVGASGVRLFLPDGLLAKGQALFGLGRTEEAYLTLTQARAEAEALGSRRTLWLILVALSEIEAQRGNQGEAHELRQQAREIIEYIADHAPPDLRASFLARAEVRSV